jgi:hypothetical protein
VGRGGLLYNTVLCLILGRIYADTGCTGVDHTQQPSQLDNRSPYCLDQRATLGGVPRAAQCARLALQVDLAG